MRDGGYKQMSFSLYQRILFDNNPLNDNIQTLFIVYCKNSGLLADDVLKLIKENNNIPTEEIKRSFKVKIGNMLNVMAAISTQLGLDFGEVSEINLNTRQEQHHNFDTIDKNSE